MTFLAVVRLLVSILNLCVVLRVALTIARALTVFAAGESVERVRLTVADGIVHALTFSTAATVLNVTILQNWADIGRLTAVFGMRTVVKRVLVWEERIVGVATEVHLSTS